MGLLAISADVALNLLLLLSLAESALKESPNEGAPVLVSDEGLVYCHKKLGGHANREAGNLLDFGASSITKYHTIIIHLCDGPMRAM